MTGHTPRRRKRCSPRGEERAALRHKLAQLYVDGSTLRAISALTGIPATSVRDLVIEEGVPMRPRGVRRRTGGGQG